jgi:hypothetical protein
MKTISQLIIAAILIVAVYLFLNPHVIIPNQFNPSPTPTYNPAPITIVSPVQNQHYSTAPTLNIVTGGHVVSWNIRNTDNTWIHQSELLYNSPVTLTGLTVGYHLIWFHDQTLGLFYEFGFYID